MTTDEKYMYRCLQLARKGLGHVSPNPMVGAVIVHEGRIIGEGYHRCYGESHAEVNAIASVKDKSKLKESTIYVSLEPCSHYGKTPPCAELIVRHEIPRVVVACLDPYPSVAGRGIAILRDAGITVEVGVLENEALELNKEFITLQTKQRPYIYLKWAQSKDGFIARRDAAGKSMPVILSNPFTQLLVHKMRSETDAIMVGTNTAVLDNPQLSTRLWSGKNPVRVVLDRTGRIPQDYKLLDNTIKTIVFTEAMAEEKKQGKISFVPVRFDEQLLNEVFKILAERNIASVMVEGGSHLLQSLIDSDLWDEACVEVADAELGSGLKAPEVKGRKAKIYSWYRSNQYHLKPLQQT